MTVRADAVPFVVAVGPLPPPVSGGTIAFREVCDDLARRGVPHRVVDVSPPQSVHVAGARVAAGRVRAWLGALRAIDAALAGAHTPHGPRPALYLLLGQARGSFLRDALCVAAARRRGARVVGHVHGGSYDLLYESLGPALRRALRAMVRRLDAVVVLGEGLRATFDFEPAARARLRVVPNALPVDGWTAPAPRTLAPGRPARLLFLSSLMETKGYLELVRAAALLRDRGIPVRVDLAGEFRQSPDDERVRSADHARALLDETVRALGLENAVTWHGSVEGEAKRALLAECDLFVLPTRYRFEGQPIALIEALAAGLPVVSTRYRAIPDVVVDGVTGRLIDAGTPEAVADAVAELLEPDAYARASRAALERARERFAPARFLERMREVLGVELARAADDVSDRRHDVVERPAEYAAAG